MFTDEYPDDGSTRAVLETRKESTTRNRHEGKMELGGSILGVCLGLVLLVVFFPLGIIVFLGSVLMFFASLARIMGGRKPLELIPEEKRGTCPYCGKQITVPQFIEVIWCPICREKIVIDGLTFRRIVRHGPAPVPQQPRPDQSAQEPPGRQRLRRANFFAGGASSPVAWPTSQPASQPPPACPPVDSNPTIKPQEQPPRPIKERSGIIPLLVVVVAIICFLVIRANDSGETPQPVDPYYGAVASTPPPATPPAEVQPISTGQQPERSETKPSTPARIISTPFSPGWDRPGQPPKPTAGRIPTYRLAEFEDLTPGVKDGCHIRLLMDTAASRDDMKQVLAAVISNASFKYGAVWVTIHQESGPQSPVGHGPARMALAIWLSDDVALYYLRQRVIPPTLPETTCDETWQGISIDWDVDTCYVRNEE